MKPLANKIAIVTGGSRGIGRAIALELASEGASVVVNYRSNAEAAEETVNEIKNAGGEATALQADVSDYGEANALVDQAIGLYNQVDILVNNAGTTADTLLLRMGEDDWDKIINTNLKSVFNCSKAVLKPMMKKARKSGYGRIINISSVSGLSGMAGQTNYAASKAGIHGFTKALAREVGARGITVNAVLPGLIKTDLTEDLPQEMVEQYQSVSALGRVGSLSEVAGVVSFIASDKASYITGELIRVDGGFAM